jgi:hypothetical protein
MRCYPTSGECGARASSWYENKRRGIAKTRAKRLLAPGRGGTEGRRLAGKRTRDGAVEEAMRDARPPALARRPPPLPPLPPAVNGVRAAKRRRRANAAVNAVCSRFADAVRVGEREDLTSNGGGRLQEQLHALQLGAKQQPARGHADAADTCQPNPWLQSLDAKVGQRRRKSGLAQGKAQRRKKKPKIARHYCRVV